MDTALRLTPAGESSSGIRSIGRGLLSVPLIFKLLGANVIIVAVTIAIERDKLIAGEWSELGAIAVPLGAACLASLALIRLALRPIDELAHLSARVSAGEFDARADESPYADSNLAALGRTINSLLDALAAERKRIQALGAQVIHAQDAERARVSRELHDSIAQTLVAAQFQLAAAAAQCDDAGARNRIEAVGCLLGPVMEELRNISNSLHSRVAEDLGLYSAIEALASQVKARSGLQVSVDSRLKGTFVPAAVAGTLFRVAQESLRNIELHAAATHVAVEVSARPGSIGIEVTDDGRGFDTTFIHDHRAVTGLASVRNRVKLAGGRMTIDSVANRGTRIFAEMTTAQS